MQEPRQVANRDIYLNHMSILYNRQVIPNCPRIGEERAINIILAYGTYKIYCQRYAPVYAPALVDAVLSENVYLRMFLEQEVGQQRLYGPIERNELLLHALELGFELIVMYEGEGGYTRRRIRRGEYPAIPRFMGMRRGIGFFIEGPSAPTLPPGAIQGPMLPQRPADSVLTREPQTQEQQAGPIPMPRVNHLRQIQQNVAGHHTPRE